MRFKLKNNTSGSYTIKNVFIGTAFFSLVVLFGVVLGPRPASAFQDNVTNPFPADGAVNVSLTPDLSWSAPSNPQNPLTGQWTVAVTGPNATVCSFSGATSGTVTAVFSCWIAAGVNELDKNTTYSWTVSYEVTDGTSYWYYQSVPTYSFTTGSGAGPPVPEKPVNFAHTSTGQTTSLVPFTWDPAPTGETPTFYRWQGGPDIGNVTSYSAGVSAPNTQIEGYVMACNSTGCSSPSTPSIFAYSSIEDATGATFSNIGVNSMDVAPQGTFTNLTVGSSGIMTGLFTNSTCSGAPKFDSGWRTTTSAYSFTGLSGTTTYWAGFQTKNGDGDTNSWTCHGSATTVDTTAPTVNVTGAPSSWQNTDATIGVSCDDGVSGSGCNAGTAATAQYLSSPPANCPTTLANGDYDQPGSYTVSSHSWFCATEQDNSGNDGFSSVPVEFKVDKIVPTFTSFTVDNSVCAKLTVTVSGAADADSGLDTASPYRFSRSRNSPKRAQFSKNTK